MADVGYEVRAFILGPVGTFGIHASASEVVDPHRDGLTGAGCARDQRRRPNGGATRRGRGEQGTALLLVPAGFLILMVLAAVAFDVSRLYVARRELVDVAASAASDVAAQSLDPDAYRTDGQLRWSQARAEAAVARSLASQGLTGRVRADVALVAAPEGSRVQVTLETDVSWLFAHGVPGTDGAPTVVRGGGWATFDAF